MDNLRAQTPNTCAHTPCSRGKLCAHHVAAAAARRQERGRRAAVPELHDPHTLCEVPKAHLFVLGHWTLSHVTHMSHAACMSERAACVNKSCHTHALCDVPKTHTENRVVRRDSPLEIHSCDVSKSSVTRHVYESCRTYV